MLTWGINNGHVWDSAAAGPAGLTVLHLAALLNDGGKVADELTGMLSLLVYVAPLWAMVSVGLLRAAGAVGCISVNSDVTAGWCNLLHSQTTQKCSRDQQLHSKGRMAFCASSICAHVYRFLLSN